MLGDMTPTQCSELALGYKASFGVSLIDELHKHLSGDFGKLAVGLVTPLPDFDAEVCKGALVCVCMRQMRLSFYASITLTCLVLM